MENYKPNSHKFKDEQKKTAATPEPVRPQKVIAGNAVVKKKTGIRKFLGTFLAEDVTKVKEFALTDVLVPSIKKAISDIVKNGVDMFLYGEAGRSRNNTVGSKISYGSYYNKPANEVRDRTVKSAYDFDDIIYPTRGDAELVLTQMEDSIDRYGFAKISDYYDLSGVTTNNHCFDNYGWTNLRAATVVRVPEGYTIKLPKALPID